MDKSIPLVSVKISTYNHEKYIGQAIESILMQKMDVPYEIVIGENCSPDRTREIVLEYQRRYPKVIRLLLHKTNIGRHNNYLTTMAACRGKYVAILDGDDYWTDPNKLQTQVDYLEEHPECAICFYDCLRMNEKNGKCRRIYGSKLPQHPTFAELVRRNFIHSCTVVFRHRVFGEYPKQFDRLDFCDWPHYVLTAEHGSITYFPSPAAVYRVHEGGLWTRGGDSSLDLKIRHLQADLRFRIALKYHWKDRHAEALEAGFVRTRKLLYRAYRRRARRNHPRFISLCGIPHSTPQPRSGRQRAESTSPAKGGAYPWNW